MKIKRQTPQRLRQKCLRGNPDGDITAVVEGRPNYITTHQISEGTHPSLALLIRDIAKQLHALLSACDDTTRFTNVFPGRPARVEHVARYGRSGQSQQGIDLFARMASGEYEVWQAKRYGSIASSDVNDDRGYVPSRERGMIRLLWAQSSRYGGRLRPKSAELLWTHETGEVLGAEWPEFDLEGKVWTVSAKRMKSNREHRVPLSPRGVEIIEKLRAVRTGAFVFPGQRLDKPLSGTALVKAQRRMGVHDATVHGFRSSFRDWCGEETNFPREIAEAALAHVTGDKAERAYRRGDALEKRRQLMAEWAAFVGAL